jgi:hypothetical protein
MAGVEEITDQVDGDMFVLRHATPLRWHRRRPGAPDGRPPARGLERGGGGRGRQGVDGRRMQV